MELKSGHPERLLPSSAVGTYWPAVEMVSRSGGNVFPGGGNGVPEWWKNEKRVEFSLIIYLHVTPWSYKILSNVPFRNWQKRKKYIHRYNY
ncbi:MAG: hypothetical protein GTN68_23385 [Candidatus Aminicenantes bacterium]|nr:hypothetical protein [Candidatus Aminicenantes bacterium]NIO83497.1 hypothetical protein [Candidatus Aminicenantes bacterium]NIQ69434.1 hypothetical protein [Candidatus Aminicenantes bacterium]